MCYSNVKTFMCVMQMWRFLCVLFGCEDFYVCVIQMWRSIYVHCSDVKICMYVLFKLNICMYTLFKCEDLYVFIVQMWRFLVCVILMWRFAYVYIVKMWKFVYVLFKCEVFQCLSLYWWNGNYIVKIKRDLKNKVCKL